jgi:hypothetical protein
VKWEQRKEGGEKNRGKERCQWGEKILMGKKYLKTGRGSSVASRCS